MTILHHWGHALRELLAQIPLTLVQGVFVAIPLLLLIWVLRLPAAETMPTTGPVHWSSNLKLWTTCALGLQILIYLVF